MQHDGDDQTIELGQQNETSAACELAATAIARGDAAPRPRVARRLEGLTLRSALTRIHMRDSRLEGWATARLVPPFETRQARM